MTIMLMSDIHYGYTDRIKQRLPIDVNRITSVQNEIDAVIVLGDVVHDGTEHDLGEVVDVFDDHGLDAYFIPGNHDRLHIDYHTFESVTGTELNSVVSINDWDFLLLDTAYGAPINHTGFIGNGGREFLQEESHEDAVILTHFPITYTELYRESQYFDRYPEGVFALDKRDSYEKPIESGEIEPPAYIFCGHLHAETGTVWQDEHDVMNESITPYIDLDGQDVNKHYTPRPII